MIWYNEFNPEPIESKTVSKGKKLFDCFLKCSCFDSETSHVESNGEMYSWIYQWCFDYYQDGRYIQVVGRTPEQFMDCVKKIAKVNKVMPDKREYTFYIHNLSYDWTFIVEYLRKEFGTLNTVTKRYDERMLCADSRRVISYSIGGLCFKCSYTLSGKGLAKWCDDLGVKVKKLTGAIDYRTVRYQDSELTDIDWKYMLHDVISMRECLEAQLDMYGDDLSTVPLTATSYVRREARRNFREDKHAKDEFKATRLSDQTYEACRNAFAGGLTHGNRFYANTIVEGKIKHRDFVSHYPSQQMCTYAPVTKYKCVFKAKSKFLGVSQETAKDIVRTSMKNKCMLVKVRIRRMCLKDDSITLPVAQFSKFSEGNFGKMEYKNDNGRILWFKGDTTLWFDEYTLYWLLKQYNFAKNGGIEFLELFTAQKGKYPNFLRKTVLEFFHDKTKYKEIEKKLKAEGASEDEILEASKALLRAKAGINGIYGMSATDPLKDNIYQIIGDDGIPVWTVEQNASLDEYYRGKNNFMSYQLGMYTTASARNELMQFVELIGYENFIYADTDSIFYLSTPEIEEKIKKQNDKMRAKSEKEGCYIDYEGKRVYFNQFDDENEDIFEFKFLHAKCYAYREHVVVNEKNHKNYSDKQIGDVVDELHATIAGVTKKGKRTVTQEMYDYFVEQGRPLPCNVGDDYTMSRTEELGSLDGLCLNKKFWFCGGTKSKYIDKQIEIVKINGHVTSLASGVVISDTEKTLKDLDQSIIDWRVALVDIDGNV